MEFSYADRAKVLAEALPYIQKYSGKTVVVKYGGNAMVSDELRRAVISDIILLKLVGINVVVVHGGGPEINEMLQKIGKQSRFVDGLRYTDQETMDIVQQVLCGKVNKHLVSIINNLGGKAIGLCGLDGSLLKADQLDTQLGFVGEIREVNAEILQNASANGYVPIVSTVAAGYHGEVFNINADVAAARIAGVDRVFLMGGAQAAAALAYGTESVPAVDKIVGPGNIYVATAKRKVYGKVGIDMIAGPSEILVLADGGCNPAWVAADLLSQAEHDRLASPVLVTDSEALALAVQAEVEVQLDALPRRDIARASVETGGKIILCGSLDQAVDVCNIIAPEHLELCVEDPFALLGRIKNAGSIFLGRNVPEALGDYFAGPNHTLPTSGTARFSSPLGVDDFVKRSSFIYYTREALGRVKDRIAGFAEAEGLHAHARSVTIRYEEGGGGK